MNVLITGVAGFIGFHVAQEMLNNGDCVYGIDNINDYYITSLKEARLKELGIALGSESFYENKNLKFLKADLANHQVVDDVFKKNKFDVVIHLAAQAGVRYSIDHPRAYINSNIVGYFNVLEACRRAKVEHFIYASSSSVYGLNERMPLSENDNVDHPISLYAASKKSNELMAHSYSHLYNLPTTGLRFFTVYGPWGRPDMALFLFTKAIIEDKPIQAFNHGKMVRDFTYIDDIVNGILQVIDNKPKSDPSWSGKNPDPSSSKAPYRVFNIGNNNPILLMDFVEEIANKLNKKPIVNMVDIQPGDVPVTNANIHNLFEYTGYKSQTSLKEGVGHFVDWYLDYFSINN